MFLAHLIVGMLCGLIAAIFVWLAGSPVWAILLTYSFVGCSGVALSVLVHLAITHIRANRHSWNGVETNHDFRPEKS